MPHAVFADATFYRVKYSGFWPLGFDFTNTDMLESSFSDAALVYTNGGFINVFVNTRFPNGSFSSVDGHNLVNDDGAEMKVSFNFYYKIC
jgi:hypothetical protein